MINNSLKDIKNIIKLILINKNSNTIDISPPFIDACLSNYCKINTCFDVLNNDDVNSSNVSSIIFDIIKKEFGKLNYTQLNDIIFSVFCTININTKTKYIDINDVWYEINHNNNDNLLYDIKFKTSCLELINTLNTEKSSILKTQEYYQFISMIKSEIYDKNITINLLNIIDSLNSNSTLGTLQFVDTLAKFNTTQSICNLDNIKDKDKKNKFICNNNFTNVLTNETMQC
jgi:hypothetical protein